jgi:hypothetical protein
MTLMLLMAHMLALGVAMMIFAWMIFLHRRLRTMENRAGPAEETLPSPSAVVIRPASWLAIRPATPEAIRAVLPEPEEFSISPRVQGWVIVTGPGLPDPGDDVDACFLFLTAVSRQLGQVQFFHAEKFSGHHAWARLADGCVTRAYAWTGETVWNQGAKTLAEAAVDIKCFDYHEDSEKAFGLVNQSMAANVDKIPALAARWSLDPAILQLSEDIPGESSRPY